MDIGRCFKDAWNLLMKDLGPLLVTALISAVIVGGVGFVVFAAWFGSLSTFSTAQDISNFDWGTFSLAMLVLVVVSLLVEAWAYGTMFKIMTRRVREGRAAQYGDMKLGFEGFGAFILAMIVLGILITLGLVAFIIPGVILMTMWCYALLVIVDRQRGLGEAMSESKALAKRPGYFMTFVTLLVGAIVVGVVSSVAGVIPVLGQIAALFINVYLLAYLVAMYFQATGETALVDQALYGVPGPGGPAAYGQYPQGPYGPGPTAPQAPGGWMPVNTGPPVPPPPPGGMQPAAPPPPPPGADAWAAAADPVAGYAPAAVPEAPAPEPSGGEEVAEAAADSDETQAVDQEVAPADDDSSEPPPSIAGVTSTEE